MLRVGFYTLLTLKDANDSEAKAAWDNYMSLCKWDYSPVVWVCYYSNGKFSTGLIWEE